MNYSMRNRVKQLPGIVGNGYALGGGQFGADVPFLGELDIDEKRMAVTVPFADGQRRDGVGDLLEVGGIDLSRHAQNPIVLFDHAKSNPLPIGKSEDPETKAYTVMIDPVSKLATGKCFFYQGKGLSSVKKADEHAHAVFCEQLFDMVANRFVRGGSIGYQVKHATNLRADYDTGIPAGLHLHNVLMLEYSIVVLPANGDTVRKGFPTVQAYDDWVDGVRHKLALPALCGNPVSPYLVKSFTPWLPPQTTVSTGYEGKSSYFGSCDRDGAGHCKPKYGTASTAGTPNAKPASGQWSHDATVKPASKPTQSAKPAKPKKVVQDHPDAQRIYDESLARHRERAAKIKEGSKDPLELSQSYEQHEQELRDAGVVATNTGFGFKKSFKSTSANLERQADACSGGNPAAQGYACGKVDKSIRLRTKGTTMPSGHSHGMPIKNAAQAQKLSNRIREFVSAHPSSPDDAQEMAALSMLKEGKALPSSKISPDKAREILHDGEANGKPLTDKQRRMFGAAASKSIRTRRKGYTPQSQMDGNPLNNTNRVDSARARYLAKVRAADAAGRENGSNAIQNRRAGKSLPNSGMKVWSDAARAASAASRAAHAKTKQETHGTAAKHSERAHAAAMNEDFSAAARHHEQAATEHQAAGQQDAAQAHTEAAAANKQAAQRSQELSSAAYKEGYEHGLSGAGYKPGKHAEQDSLKRSYDLAHIAGTEKRTGKKWGSKSISVGYKNKLVRGFTNLNMKFNLRGIEKDKQEAFLKEMHESGMGAPKQGGWNPTVSLGKPLRLATYDVDIDPTKHTDADGNDAMALLIGKAAGIARKHGVRFFGNNTRSQEPVAVSKEHDTGAEAPAPKSTDKSVRNRTKALVQQVTNQAEQIKRLVAMVNSIRFPGAN